MRTEKASEERQVRTTRILELIHWRRGTPVNNLLNKAAQVLGATKKKG